MWWGYKTIIVGFKQLWWDEIWIVRMTMVGFQCLGVCWDLAGRDLPIIVNVYDTPLNQWHDVKCSFDVYKLREPAWALPCMDFIVWTCIIYWHLQNPAFIVCLPIAGYSMIFPQFSCVWSGRGWPFDGNWSENHGFYHPSVAESRPRVAVTGPWF